MKLFTVLIASWSFLAIQGQVPDFVPTDALVSWHNLNGNAVDELGNHPGESNGTFPTENHSGVPGQALGFAEGDFVSLGTYTEIQGQCEFSTSVWFYAHPEQNSSGCCNMIWCSGYDQWLLHLSNWENLLGFGGGLSCGASDSEVILPGNFYDTWHHAVAQRTSTGIELWVDGVLVDTAETTWCVCSHDSQMMLGTMDGYPHYFNGFIDDFGVWSRALEPWEVQHIFSEQPLIHGCIDESACNYNPEADVDDGSCIPSGCNNPSACNFNPDAGCDDGSCELFNPLLCNVDSLVVVDLCGADSIMIGLQPEENASPVTPFTQLNWKASCDFQENWATLDFDDSAWSIPESTVCNDQTLIANYENCGGDDHMLWFNGCSENYFRTTMFLGSGEQFNVTIGADDVFELYMNGDFVQSGNNWGECYSADLTSFVHEGLNLLAVRTEDTGGCQGLFGQFYGNAFEDFIVWETGEFSRQIWVDVPGFYVGEHQPSGVTIGYIVTALSIMGCTDVGACNYSEVATCDDGSCIYPIFGDDCFTGAVSCGPGTIWDVEHQHCIPLILTCPEDLNEDGVVGVDDLLQVLGVFGLPCEAP